ncbi:sulfate reduction electron transfer complex DsrMKJOP subunit DsrO [Calderihabitans maritimus]|uniref:Fe-S-cluster-containing hydrogenase components 1 n=1 Tax=Calderihabitans maritimus TaxID=1246530 RepID=A0A1Z5HQF4_9FIRM|nr:4Fe-4S dicluster domain-containing protein [Calderihabitans maritimus]GAW91759.1 Fe-S-cluster-containing hydrogenase components 1 [Calderihabitans maritimus]
MRGKRMDRRTFLKVAGACVLGLGVMPVTDVFGGNDLPKILRNPNALVGKKWAMVVDMKKCWDNGEEGCVDCIRACHRTHNVPNIGNAKEEIKWIWTASYENAFPDQKNEYMEESLKGKPFIVLCNHCANPPCVRVCPTKATFKREDGIVIMDYHRCIGCRYCMAACPYGARSFNFKDPRPFIAEVNPKFPTREKGVVEKCNFCAERLAEGLLPACVEACKHGALVFGDLEDPESNVRKILRSNYIIQRKPQLGTKPNIYYIV